MMPALSLRARHAIATAAAALWLASATVAAPPRGPQPSTVDTRPVPAHYRPSPLPEGWHRGAFMEIFVRAYQDSDGDGVGDLRGLTQRLDHLHALGVTGLWLMPITASADHDHGYATTDYRRIEPAYGTLADFDELIRQAHARGMGVIMDYVINHSAAEHPLFQQAVSDAHSPWRDWYVFSPTLPVGWDIWGKNPWYHTAAKHWLSALEPKDLPPAPPGARDFYFGTFGPHMPDFNLRNPAVWAYHADSLRFWLNRGVDGFRLDAVPHMVENGPAHWNDQPESRQLTRQLRELITRYDKRWVVCEATAQPLQWAAPEVCGSAFAFGYVEHYVKAARGEPASIQALAEFWRQAPAGLATMVSNHDIFAGPRLWDQLQGDEARYKLVAASYLLQPGTPFIYFGEEIGQAGALGVAGDLPLRSPMSWTADAQTAGFTTGRPFRPLAPNRQTHNAAAQAAQADSLLHFYSAMLRLRNSRPSLSQGSFQNSFVQGQVLGFERQWQQERTLVLINYGSEPVELNLPTPATSTRQTARQTAHQTGWQRLYPAGAAAGGSAEGVWRVRLPGLAVWVMQPGA